MNALTLWNPWAELIAAGLKQVETRSWKPPADIGDLLICSARRPFRLELDVRDLDVQARIWSALERIGHPRGVGLTYGFAVAVVNVSAVYATEDLRLKVSEDELAFGDYSTGRFGWVLSNVRRIKQPFHVMGRQGLFSIDDGPWLKQALA